jgi:hypothetical protein
MRKVDHKELIQLGKKLDYDIGGGICNGFSMMLVQAFFAKDETTFFYRLRVINAYRKQNSSFSTLLEDINTVKNKVKLYAQKESKQDKKLTLTSEEKFLLDILAFYDGVVLYQRSFKHKSVFNVNFISSDHPHLVYKITYPELIKNTSLFTHLNQSYIFNKERLKQFFQELTQLLKQEKKSVPIILKSEDHAMVLYLNQDDSTWTYVDTNDFERYSSEYYYPEYFRKLSVNELAANIFSSLFCTYEKYLALNVNLFTSEIELDNEFNKAWD